MYLLERVGKMKEWAARGKALGTRRLKKLMQPMD